MTAGNTTSNTLCSDLSNINLTVVAPDKPEMARRTRKPATTLNSSRVTHPGVKTVWLQNTLYNR